MWGLVLGIILTTCWMAAHAIGMAALYDSGHHRWNGALMAEFFISFLLIGALAGWLVVVGGLCILLTIAIVGGIAFIDCY